MTCVHDLHLKPISHSIAVSIQETASQLTDELPHDKMINNHAHELCAWLALKTHISQYCGEYIQETASQLTDELPV